MFVLFETFYSLYIPVCFFVVIMKFQGLVINYLFLISDVLMMEITFTLFVFNFYVFIFVDDVV